MLMIPVLMILKVPGNTTSGSTSSKDSTAPAMNRGGTEGAENSVDGHWGFRIVRHVLRTISCLYSFGAHSTLNGGNSMIVGFCRPV